jgi:hypothetical protein
MKRYIDEGRTQTFSFVEEPFTEEKIYLERFKKIESTESTSKFLSVDASSYPLIRANNWRIGVSRCAYVLVEKIDGRWTTSKEGYVDHIFSIFAPLHQRAFQVWARLREYESQLAISALDNLSYDDFCVMDGAAFFGLGGGSKYSVELYDACKTHEIRLLMVSKNSPILHDKAGRDLLASISIQGLKLQERGKLGRSWIYHPIRKARTSPKDLYGDVTCVKLSSISPRVFRCDIMDYLIDKDEKFMLDAISELSTLAYDARCDGYPAPLFLAHQRTKIPEAILIEYFEETQLSLREKGLLDFLLREANVAGFRKHLLGITFDFNLQEYDV